MRQLTELKQGDKIYDVDFGRLRWYTYLCVHPNNKKYHILIDECKDPVRIYANNLQEILNKNLRTYQAAKLALADEFESAAKRLREEKSVEV